ncbi:unnamed protein product, partial [Nezara viridula]
MDKGRQFALIVILAEKFEDVVAACNKENGLNEDFHSLNYNDPAFPKAAKCALSCLFEKRDVFKSDGSIDKAKAIAMNEEAVTDEDLKKKFLKAIDECDLTAKANKCETAFEFVKCKRNKVLSETVEGLKELCKGPTEKNQKFNIDDPDFPKEAKCMLACGLEMKGMFKGDGSIDIEREKLFAEALMENEEIKKNYIKAFVECDPSAKENKCETAYQFAKCMKNK